jgi:hypothetical protein
MPVQEQLHDPENGEARALNLWSPEDRKNLEDRMGAMG